MLVVCITMTGSAAEDTILRIPRAVFCGQADYCFCASWYQFT